MAWTRFMDMHSGGGLKEPPYDRIYIEAPADEARRIFYNRFGHNPDRVSCTCCGADYSIDDAETLERASAYDRGCDYDERAKAYVESPATKYNHHPYKTLGEYMKSPDVLFIPASEIQTDERVGEVPQQGYVWV